MSYLGKLALQASLPLPLYSFNCPSPPWYKFLSFLRVWIVKVGLLLMGSRQSIAHYNLQRVGVLFGQARVTSSPLYIWLDIFDLELGGQGSELRTSPPSFLLTVPHPPATNSFLSSVFCCCKIKDGSYYFHQKILSTWLPNSWLFCRLSSWQSLLLNPKFTSLGFDS